MTFEEFKNLFIKALVASEAVATRKESSVSHLSEVQEQGLLWFGEKPCGRGCCSDYVSAMVTWEEIRKEMGDQSWTRP